MLNVPFFECAFKRSDGALGISERISAPHRRTSVVAGHVRGLQAAQFQRPELSAQVGYVFSAVAPDFGSLARNCPRGEHDLGGESLRCFEPHNEETANPSPRFDLAVNG